MRDDQKWMLKGALLPVLLGDSLRTHLLSLGIYARCGVQSLVCDEKKSALSVIDPTSKFFDLISVSEGAAVMAALEHIAANTDYLPVLIPMSERFLHIVEENRETLEALFIITSKENVWSSAPFAALMKGE